MKTLHIIDYLNQGGAQTLLKNLFKKQKINKNIFLFSLRKKNIITKIDHQNVKIFNSNKSIYENIKTTVIENTNPNTIQNFHI